MRLSAIAAIGEQRELGKENKLLWHIPGELPRFKRLTTGHPIIMGRKTFDSIGRILPNRTNIIITRDPSYTVEGGVVVHSLDEAILDSSVILNAPQAGGEGSSQEDSSHASNAAQNDKNSDKNEIFVIGGGQIFTEALPLVDRLYLTIVHKTFDADAFFPEYTQFTKVIEKEDHVTDEFAYTFLTLEKP